MSPVLRRRTQQSSDLSPLELERNAPLSEAAYLSGVSTETLRRHYGHLILQLSKNRQGLKVKDALAIGRSSSPDAA